MGEAMRVSLSILLFFLLSSLAPGLSAAVIYPGLSGRYIPVPAPTLPSYYDTFTPPTSTASAVSGSPTFAEWIHQAQPGDTILFTGSLLSGFTFYGQTSSGNGTLLPATAYFQNSLESQVTLSTCLPANSTYLVWSSNASGASIPACLNCTELWWGLDTAQAGDTASVSGRNFYYGGVTPTVYVQVAGQMGTTATLVDYNNYRIDYTMPNLGVASGSTVEVWVHNGHGGSYGWSGPITVTVQTTVNDESYWTGSTFNVKNFGAVGDGVTNDGPAIEMALTTAAQSYANTGLPATVYLPGSVSGTTYLTDQGFANLAHVRWMGDGPSETSLSLGPSYATSANPYGLFYEVSGQLGHADDVEIEDMTLNMNNNLQGTETTSIGYSLMLEDANKLQNFKLNNLTIYSGESLTAAAAGEYGSSAPLNINSEGSHVWIQNCTIYGGGLFFGAQNQVFVDRCNFYGQYDAEVFAYTDGGNGFSLTNCTAQDYANTLTFTPDVNQDPNPYYFEGRLFDGVGNGNHDIYIAGNTTIDCAPRVGTGNSLNAGEQLLWEGGTTAYNGSLSAAGPGDVQIPASSTAYGPDADGRSYYYVVVVAGDGLGQDRLVTADNGSGLLTVSPNWNVVPDSTSTIQVQGINDETAVYANQLQGKPGYLSSGTSSAGASLYNNCFGFVVDGNQISQMVSGLYMASSIDDTGLHPGYFDLLTNNNVSNSLNGATTNFVNYVDTDIDGIAILGADMRRNNLDNTGAGTMTNGFQELVNDSSGYFPRIASALIDQNTATDLSTAAAYPTPAPASITNTVFSDDSPCSYCVSLTTPCVNTATPTSAASPTASHSPTASPTATATPSPIPSSTATYSPSATPTATWTNSSSPSETWTVTPSMTPSMTATASATTGPSSSASPSPTATASPSTTPTASISVTGDSSPTATRTASTSPTAIFTEPGTATPSAGATTTRTSSPSSTPTSNGSATMTASPTATESASSTPSATQVATWTPTAKVTASAQGPGAIIKTVAWPDPNPHQIAVDLSGACSSLTLQIYTESRFLAAEVTTQSVGPGWVSIALPPKILGDAASGAYFYCVSVQNVRSKAIGCFALIR